MQRREQTALSAFFDRHERELLEQWRAALKAGRGFKTGRIGEEELLEQTQNVVVELKAALKGGSNSIEDKSWLPMRRLMAEISQARVLQGYSPSETATFIFSIKQPLFKVLRRELAKDGMALTDLILEASQVIDELGLYTTEVYQKSREEVIARQGRELLELSTPVVQLWAKILALPLIGTLDSERTQIVMERLLQSIVDAGAEIAIIDISGVPTVDTLVAQHLIKTVSAARLMGADCIISGIRPQIAQTIVHLGLDLKVVSKATMADAFALALRRTGQTVSFRAAKDID